MKEIIATYFVLLVGTLTGTGQATHWIYPTHIESMNHDRIQLWPANCKKSVLAGFALVTEEKEILVDLSNRIFDIDKIGWSAGKNKACDFRKFSHVSFFEEAVKRQCNTKVKVKGE
jgi:hypothetical protein